MNINLTFLGQMIAFATFVWFCMRYVWPPIIDALQQRENKIKDSLHAAQIAEGSVKEMREQIKKQDDEAKKDRAKMIEEAKAQSKKIIENAKSQAKSDSDRAKDLAEENISMQYKQAEDKLRQEIKCVSLVIARKIVGEEFAKNTDIDNDFIDKKLADFKHSN